MRTWQTASAISVTFIRGCIGGRPRNRANSIASLRAEPFGGAVTYTIGIRDLSANRVLIRSFRESAELFDRGGPVAAARNDQPAPGADLALVEQGQQPAFVGDALDRRRGDHDQFTVMRATRASL